MAIEDDGAPGTEELVPRAPEETDLVAICRRLNELGARYVVIGGFAIIYGFTRDSQPTSIWLIDTSLTNEALVYQALEVFPDRAVRDLKPGEVFQYNVVRVCDEVVFALMKSACGVDYEQASKEVIVRDVKGVAIPFASARLLWRTKKRPVDQRMRPICSLFQNTSALAGRSRPRSRFSPGLRHRSLRRGFLHFIFLGVDRLPATVACDEDIRENCFLRVLIVFVTRYDDAVHDPNVTVDPDSHLLEMLTQNMRWQMRGRILDVLRLRRQNTGAEHMNEIRRKDVIQHRGVMGTGEPLIFQRDQFLTRIGGEGGIAL
jgi:hypothetical protein